MSIMHNKEHFSEQGVLIFSITMSRNTKLHTGSSDSIRVNMSLATVSVFDMNLTSSCKTKQKKKVMLVMLSINGLNESHSEQHFYANAAMTLLLSWVRV